jgi:hypothetical protein
VANTLFSSPFLSFLIRVEERSTVGNARQWHVLLNWSL